MQIKNKLLINRYAFGTILNIAWVIPILGLQNISIALAFLIFILLNHYFLIILVADLTGVDKNNSLIPTPLCGALKLIFLVFAFFIGIKFTENKEIFFVLMYLAQIVVLVFSMRKEPILNSL